MAAQLAAPYFAKGFSVFKVANMGLSPDGVMLDITLVKGDKPAHKDITFVRRALGAQTDAGVGSMSNADLSAYLKQTYFNDGWTLHDMLFLGMESGLYQHLYVLVK
jgi:hypothetical protein